MMCGLILYKSMCNTGLEFVKAKNPKHAEVLLRRRILEKVGWFKIGAITVVNSSPKLSAGSQAVAR